MFFRRSLVLASLCFALVAVSVPASARQISWWDELVRLYQSQIDTAPATAQIEVGFSPEGSAERLVIKAINASTQRLRVAAYVFTSPTVVRALVEAKQRGVDVQVVVDKSSPKVKSSASALNLLVNAGIPVGVNAKYAIFHDKYIVIDEQHLQTGSFNYSRAAAKSNSENVIVIWHNPELAAAYERQWRDRFAESRPYRRSY